MSRPAIQMTTIKAMPVVLRVDTVGNDLIASVVFRNNSGDFLFVDPIAICVDGAMLRSLFSVYDENRRLVPYTDRQRTLRPEFFFEIKPGERFSATITLSRYYKLKKGHKYTLQYLAFNPKYEDKSQLTAMVSNRVEVIY